MKWICLVIALAGAPLLPVANARAPLPTDYADGFTIDITQPGPLIMVPLTAAVYRAAVSDQLQDLAVFDAAGNLAPHAVRTSPPGPERAVPRDVALPVFPYGEAVQVANPAVTISAGGALVRIDAGATPADPASATRYLIDASHIGERIGALTVVFADGEGEVMSTVAVDGSDDLDRWQTLVHERRLASLHYGGHTLAQRRIDLPPGPRLRYLQLRFLEPGPAPAIAQVTAEIVAVTATAGVAERLRFSGIAPPGNSAAIDFDLGAALPVSEVGVVLPANELFEATLQSRQTPSATWQTRYRGVFYALERDGLLLRPGPRQVGPLSHRYWRLTAFAPRPPGTHKLEFEVAWQPATVIFLAAGTPPYTLAVGRAPAGIAPLPQTPALTRFDHENLAGRATLAARRELGGDARRSAVRPMPWSQIGLWLVLAAGVAAAAVMVVRLLRQMRGS